MNIRPARVEDLPQMANANLMNLPENYRTCDVLIAVLG